MSVWSEDLLDRSRQARRDKRWARLCEMAERAVGVLAAVIGLLLALALLLASALLVRMLWVLLWGAM